MHSIPNIYILKLTHILFHPYKYINHIVLQDFFIFAFRFWTFNIREGQCYLKFGRGGLRPNDERGVFVSGSTRDDGCSKFYQKKVVVSVLSTFIVSYMYSTPNILFPGKKKTSTIQLVQLLTTASFIHCFRKQVHAPSN